MKRKIQTKPAHDKEGLVIRSGNDAPLSRIQVEFNRLMKNLEAAKARHAKEETRLDEVLATAIRELMPLIESLKRVNLGLVFTGVKAMQIHKLTATRRHWFGDLLSGKAGELVADPVGLSDEEIAELEAIILKLGPNEADERQRKGVEEEFDFMVKMLEQAARDGGVDLDLSDLDPHGNPEEFERLTSERLAKATEEAQTKVDSATASHRKASKVEANRERKRLEQQDAKSRDLKSLFKQLAKAFHPDLEPEPLLKEHKKVWMQRLNTAYAAADLREMLQLEMEWLGEEATNLATAGDAKLKVYCMVLKEQIEDLKRQTHFLLNQPQYGPLQRFRHPYYGTLASPVTIKRELRDKLSDHRYMLETLSAHDAGSRRMIHQWADDNARQSSYAF